MFDLVRTSIHRVITTPVGDGFFALRVPKDLARRLNQTLGEPICSKDELHRRREAMAKLEELRRGGGDGSRAKAAAQAEAKATAAPVMIYFEGERNARELGRIKEALDAKAIAYTLLNVAGDETSKAFVLRESKRKEDELPVVFVAGEAVGGYNELVAWDVSGKLTKAVFGG